MRVLITGAAGMVGRNLRERLAGTDHQVVAADRSVADLLDGQAVRALLARARPDIIVHAAGRVGGIQANMAAPSAFLSENLLMGVNLVLAAKEAGIERMLNLGSSCMYPRDSSQALVEEQILTGPLEPTNEGYALAKISVARLCQYVSGEAQRFRYKTLIPCNLFGRWDKFDPASSHMIAGVIDRLHRAREEGTETLAIWGDGKARREYLYAGDLADCLARAIARFDDIPPVMNVGPGNDHTIDEYYRVIADVVGYRGAFTHDTSRPVGMARKLVDVSRLKAWGWEPPTSLREGIRKTYEFYLGNVVS